MLVSRRRVSLVILLLMSCALPACANGQRADDPCPSAAFRDAMKRVDYQLKRAELLGSSAALRSADLALSEARLALVNGIANQLNQARFSAETAKMKALQSDSVREVLLSIGDACFDRIVKNPQAEVAAVNEAAKALRVEGQSPEKYRQETARIERDYASPTSTLKALRNALEQVRHQVEASRK